MQITSGVAALIFLLEILNQPEAVYVKSGENYSGADTATIRFYAYDVDLTIKCFFKYTITDEAGNEIQTKKVWHILQTN